MNIIDRFLNNITMYRLVLYVLLLYVVAGGILSYFGLLPFNLVNYVFSALLILIVSVLTNTIFAKAFKVSPNVESVYITALILFLIITPAKTINDLIFLFWLGVLANASKYILALGKKHIFNPAALAVVITSLTINQSASWWVGSRQMFALLLIGGLLIVRKTRRTDLVYSFLFVSLVIILGSAFLNGTDVINQAQKILLETPLVFFSTIMLTEPLTTPPTSWLQTLYGGLVGFLFTPQIHLGTFYTTPEIALALANIFSYIVSPKYRLVLKLQEKNQIAADVYEFVFDLDKKIKFTPGQYLEWTLGHKNPDSRGNRRYFTLASSPTEDNIRLGVKFYSKPSSFKKAMFGMPAGSEIVGLQLSGDFVLPKDPNKKCVLIAGGIGITPFRSQIKYLLDNHKKRDFILFYANRLASEIAYKDIFDQARRDLGIKIVYTLTGGDIPKNWFGRTGRISEQMIKEEVPDYRERYFYLSGPYAMVSAFEDLLKKMSIKKDHIITDFFPGFT